MSPLNEAFKALQLVDVTAADLSAFKKHLADVVILTAADRLLLQSRPNNWLASPGCITLFGGHVEEDEQPLDAAVREIHEEIGGTPAREDLVSLGAVSENWTNHTELVHLYFWQDTQATITGCYEAESIEFCSCSEAVAHPKLMPYARWALEECKKRGLIP